jgi:hypothetical protein
VVLTPEQLEENLQRQIHVQLMQDELMKKQEELSRLEEEFKEEHQKI